MGGPPAYGRVTLYRAAIAARPKPAPRTSRVSSLRVTIVAACPAKITLVRLNPSSSLFRARYTHPHMSQHRRHHIPHVPLVCGTKSHIPFTIQHLPHTQPVGLTARPNRLASALKRASDGATSFMVPPIVRSSAIYKNLSILLRFFYRLRRFMRGHTFSWESYWVVPYTGNDGTVWRNKFTVSKQ